MEVAKQYKFYSIFPTNISAIDLSYDSADTIEEFTVEFQLTGLHLRVRNLIAQIIAISSTSNNVVQVIWVLY